MSAFGSSEAKEMFRSEVRNYARREVAPTAKERAKAANVPRDVIRKLGRDQYLGIPIPEDYGGQGSNWFFLGIAMEELAKVSLAEAFVCMMPPLAHLVLTHATKELRNEWLPSLVSGDRTCCWALTEPGAGSDAAAIRSRAVRNGDSYVLSGEKAPVSMGCSADVAMFFAKTDPAAGARGVSCFWMPLDLPGITSSPISHTGWKPMSAASVNLVDVVLAKSLLVGEEGKGFSITMGMADCARPLVGLLALGLAQSSLDEAATYVQQRSAFGRPLSKFEGISFSIAERATSIEAARLLCYNTLAMEDEGLRHTKESAMCKLLCPEVAISTIHASIRMHGHVGYSEYYPLEQRLRDAVGFEFTDGTPEIMKLVIARELMGRMAVPY